MPMISIKALLRRSAARRYERPRIWVKCMFGCGLLRAGDVQDRMKRRISSPLIWGKLFLLRGFGFISGGTD
jgi:hypothetical protein